MIGDPYEEADSQQRMDEAKLMTPAPARRNRKIFVVGMVVAGILLGLVILANIAGLVTGRVTPNARPVPKPITMTKAQSDSFAQQQSGQAAYMKGMDRDRKVENAEDTVLGHGDELAGAGDRYDEVDGVPKKTKAQDDAEHGRGTGGQGSKSEAQQRYERAALEAAHRRQNDLDSSPVSIDFSEYFEKEKGPQLQARRPNLSPRKPQKYRQNAGARLWPMLSTRKSWNPESSKMLRVKRLTIRNRITNLIHRPGNSIGSWKTPFSRPCW